MRLFFQRLWWSLSRLSRRLVRQVWSIFWHILLGFIRIIGTLALYLLPFLVAALASVASLVYFYEIAPGLSLLYFLICLPFVRSIHRWRMRQRGRRLQERDHIPTPDRPPVNPSMSSRQVEDVIQSVVSEMKK